TFIRDLKLDEELDGADDVIDQLRPTQERDLLAAEFRRAVLDNSADPSSLDKTGGLDLNEWNRRLINARTSLVGAYLARDTNEVDRLLNDWVESAPAHVIDTIERYIARQGLPVVVELLEQLSRALRA